MSVRVGSCRAIWVYLAVRVGSCRALFRVIRVACYACRALPKPPTFSNGFPVGGCRVDPPSRRFQNRFLENEQIKDLGARCMPSQPPAATHCSRSLTSASAVAASGPPRACPRTPRETAVGSENGFNMVFIRF